MKAIPALGAASMMLVLASACGSGDAPDLADPDVVSAQTYARAEKLMGPNLAIEKGSSQVESGEAGLQLFHAASLDR